MGNEREVRFAAALRRYRRAAGLTQEELAEQAHLSVSTVGALERGVNQAPHAETARLLADALGLAGRERAAFEAARRPIALGASVQDVATAVWAQPDAGAALTDAFAPRVCPTNLPVALTSFIGRAREQAAVTLLLRRERVLTLTGAGGCGKTRLALHVAGEVLENYPDGVWLVELAPLATPALVTQTVADVLGVREESGRSLTATLTDVLRTKRLLLILDNCEHLIAACADLASTLVPACPHLQILATSREALGVAGERAWTVPPLALPASAQTPLADVLAAEAVQLFAARAQAAREGFGVTERNAARVLQICRRLDGLPLALELAAARLSSLSLEDLAARLDDRFRVLTGGSRTALPRQQTLRATLEWSYALLAGGERVLLRRLAVFAGGWTLEAAEAVCAGDGTAAEAVLDLLANLVHKSLVRFDASVEVDGGESRYRLLETVRQYAREHLEASGELEALRERHLAWSLTLAERAEAGLQGRGQMRWVARLAAELGNLRVALEWARTSRQMGRGLRLAVALRLFWDKHGPWGEGRRWLEGFVAWSAGDATQDAVDRARALTWAGRLAWMQLDMRAAAALAEQGLALVRRTEDTESLAEALWIRGVVADLQGETMRALALVDESLALSRTSGDTRAWANALYAAAIVRARYQDHPQRAAVLAQESLRLYCELGHSWDIGGSFYLLAEIALAQGDLEQAQAMAEKELAVFRALEERRGLCGALLQLNVVARERGDLDRAMALSEEHVTVARDLGAGGLIGQALRALGATARDQGDLARAEAALTESLGLLWAGGIMGSVARCLVQLAAVMCAQERAQRAAWLAGAAAALLAHVRVRLRGRERDDHGRTVAAVRAALGEQTFAAAWQEGQALPLEDVVAVCAGNALMETYRPSTVRWALSSDP